MDRALGLAERGWGNVAPNPLVGAVLVRDGAVLSEGWHARHGGPHAEIAALSATGDASGATLYVTLEPCAHHGLTPPCTDAILRAGIARLVFAAADPNPVAAGGAEVLRAGGIDVTGGVMAERARRLNAGFFHAHETGTCWVALKLALSLDGAIAAAPGMRTQLTGPGAQTETHRLRAGFDAVLVGIGTATVDDPLLTARTTPPPRLPVARVVFDAKARLSPDSSLVRTAAESPVHVVCSDSADRARVQVLADTGVHVHRVAPAAAGVALDDAFRALWDAGLRSILCEGGARLARALISADRIGRLYLWVTPRMLGEAGVRGWSERTPDAWQFIRSQAFGPDVLVEYDRPRDMEG